MWSIFGLNTYSGFLSFFATLLFMKGPVIYGELEAADHSKLYHKTDNLGYSALVCFLVISNPPKKSFFE